jgi:lipoprotein signal peptidase
MNLYTAPAPELLVRAKPKLISGRRSLVLALLATVIVIDQAVKWWAWRHAADPFINYGGDPLTGRTVSSWYAAPTTGALLDMLDFGILSVAIVGLLRWRRPAPVLITGALLVGGWFSNLLDRLGMHYLTAPGSVRGAVDFIHIGHRAYNVADFFIIVFTVPFIVATAVSYLRRSSAKRSVARGSTTHRAPLVRTWAWLTVFAVIVCLSTVVGIGAARYGGLTEPVASRGGGRIISGPQS